MKSEFPIYMSEDSWRNTTAGKWRDHKGLKGLIMAARRGSITSAIRLNQDGTWTELDRDLLLSGMEVEI